MNKKRLWITILLGILSGLAVKIAAAELTIAMPGTRLAHFTYRDAPLLSFGGMSDFVFYFPESTYDYRQWADWQADHGMNHLRAYPPLSYRTMEVVFNENQMTHAEMMFPYMETEPGSRRFDLEQFSETYWHELRKKLAYLHDKGIIVHLIIFNGWNITHDPSENWDGHFFNPAVNINPATHHLATNEYAFYHSVADGRSDLIALQKSWIRKLVEAAAGFDNVYYDLVHEMTRTRQGGWITERGEWEKVKPWIDTMAATLRDRHKELNGTEAVVGLDAGPFTRQQRDWVFSRPYFDILIYGKRHEVRQAIQWRKKYRKPYVPQESWDDNGAKWSYRFPDHRTQIRKYVWKMMMAKAQQLDIYVKPPKKSYSPDALNAPGLPERYDPRGWNEFEKDAVLLRQFWNQIEDYGSLQFQGKVIEGPGYHQLVLSSTDEALVYLSSKTGEEAVEFATAELRLSNLGLDKDAYTARLFSPTTGAIGVKEVTIRRGKSSLSLPAFVDDIMIHITPATDAVDSALTSAEVIPIGVQPAGAQPPGRGAYQPDGDGQFVIEAEHYELNVSQGGRDWVDDFTTGYMGDGAMQSVPNSFLKITSNIATNSPRMDYKVELVAPAMLNVWVRGLGLSGSHDSVWVGVNGDDATAQYVPLTRGGYGWKKMTGQISLTAGVHTINVWMREDGSIVDKLLLTPLSTVPTDDGGAPGNTPQEAFDDSFAVDEDSTGSANGTVLINGTSDGLLYTPAARTQPSGSGAYQPDSNGQFVMEAEHHELNVSQGGRDWVDNLTTGYVGDGAMQSVPNTFMKVTSNIATNSPRMDYQVELAAPATLNVWVRGQGLSGSHDSVWVGVNGDDATAQYVPLTRDSFGWKKMTGQISLAVGVHTINVWMREDGSIVDRLLLTPLSTVPTGGGPAESARGGPASR